MRNNTTNKRYDAPGGSPSKIDLRSNTEAHRVTKKKKSTKSPPVERELFGAIDTQQNMDIDPPMVFRRFIEITAKPWTKEDLWPLEANQDGAFGTAARSFYSGIMGVSFVKGDRNKQTDSNILPVVQKIITRGVDTATITMVLNIQASSAHVLDGLSTGSFHNLFCCIYNMQSTHQVLQGDPKLSKPYPVHATVSNKNPSPIKPASLHTKTAGLLKQSTEAYSQKPFSFGPPVYDFLKTGGKLVSSNAVAASYRKAARPNHYKTASFETFPVPPTNTVDLSRTRLYSLLLLQSANDSLFGTGTGTGMSWKLHTTLHGTWATFFNHVFTKDPDPTIEKVKSNARMFFIRLYVHQLTFF